MIPTGTSSNLSRCLSEEDPTIPVILVSLLPIPVDEGDLHAVLRRYAVGTVGVIQKSYLESLDILDKRHFFLTIERIAVRTDMIYSERVKSHQSAPGGTVSPVKTMKAQIDQARLRGDGGYDYSDCFTYIAPTVTEADYAVCNLSATWID